MGSKPCSDARAGAPRSRTSLWEAPARAPPAHAPPAKRPARLPVDEIEGNPFQPRRDFDEAAIAKSAESLKEHGLIQPLVVRRHGQRWQLVAGERRLRAAVKAGWTEVPAQVREADDRQMTEIAIVENLQRQGPQSAGKGRRCRNIFTATAAPRKSWPAG